MMKLPMLLPTAKLPDLERTGASPEAIISHYDKGEDFFELVLGPELIYSCALFEGDDDLAERSAENLIIISKRRTPPTQNACSTLGAGGSHASPPVDHAEVPHVVGLTLSPSQLTGSAANRDPDSKWLSETGAIISQPSGTMPLSRSVRSSISSKRPRSCEKARCLS